MTIGNADDLTRESAGDPLENARAFEADGRARQDAFNLRQAAQAYRSAGDLAKAKECKARALEAEKKMLEAGQAYFDAGFAIPDGVRCLWRAGTSGRAQLCENTTQFPEVLHELEFEWARTIRTNAAAPVVAEILNRFAVQLDQPAFAESCAADPAWREGLKELLKPLSKQRDAAIASETMNLLASSLQRIRQKGVAIPASESAQVFLSAGRYADAIAAWEECGEIKSNAYLRAKAAVEPYPQRILSLAKLNEPEEIIKAHVAAPGVALSSEQAAGVVDAYCSLKQRPTAIDLAWNWTAAVPMCRIAADAIQSGAAPDAQRALQASVILLARQKQWEPLATFAATQRFTPTTEWNESIFREFVKAQLESLQVTLVRAMARSEGLLENPAHVQRQLSDFLKGYLRVKDGHWKPHLSVEEAGAAIERAGRFTDAISYYEAIGREGFSETERQFARRRWLVCKKRQLDHERSQGAKRKVNEIERELDRGLLALRIKSVEELGTYPKLPALQKPDAAHVEQVFGAGAGPLVPALAPSAGLDTESPLADHLTMTIGQFKIDLSRKNNRCNITHTSTMETGYIKIAERSCGGECEFSRVNDSRWQCVPWKLAVEFPTNSRDVLLIDFEECGVALQMQQ
ncbi:MAG: hypothetical protein EXS05_22385 [Planctomycetaceae bacterium]|nr:hypothetical protein [Planctomycetaceae bacterium]